MYGSTHQLKFIKILSSQKQRIPWEYWPQPHYSSQRNAYFQIVQWLNSNGSDCSNTHPNYGCADVESNVTQLMLTMERKYSALLSLTYTPRDSGSGTLVGDILRVAGFKNKAPQFKFTQLPWKPEITQWIKDGEEEKKDERKIIIISSSNMRAGASICQSFKPSTIVYSMTREPFISPNRNGHGLELPYIKHDHGYDEDVADTDEEDDTKDSLGC
ncbi:hypothetical protein VNO77_27448 [Canavalia gladiata]|uniref:Uncharacterized protein n=1 Tax=Canavalia gladiata TaxID=3824 RepID=A0AAN9Q6I1_CANGL